MVKLARVGCVIFPMIITLGGIVALLSVIIGGQKKDIKRNNYWLKIDTRWVTDPDMRKKWPVDKKSGFKDYPSQTKASELGLADFYTVGLWNTCEGKFKVDKDDDKPIWKITKCNKAKGDFYFDIIKILKESSTFRGNGEDDIPKRLKDARSLSKRFHRVVLLCYVIAVIASVFTFLVGWFGLFSRWGSCVTLIFAEITMGTTFAGSLMATIIYQGYRGAFRLTRSKFGIDTEINGLVQALAWIAFGLAFVASFFWIFSSCCCSGKRDKIMGKDKKKEGKQIDDGDSIMGSANINSSSNRVEHSNVNGQQGLNRSSFESQNLGPAMVPVGGNAPQYAYSSQTVGEKRMPLTPVHMPITPGPLHPGNQTPGCYQDFNTARYTEQPPLRNPRGPFEAYRI